MAIFSGFLVNSPFYFSAIFWPLTIMLIFLFIDEYRNQERLQNCFLIIREGKDYRIYIYRKVMKQMYIQKYKRLIDSRNWN